MVSNDHQVSKQYHFEIILAVFFLVILIRTAWISEDAYITLRTVDNFVHGYHLNWNIDERVQTYTHPLWMCILSAVYFFTREPYYTTLSISWLLSLGSFILLLRFARPSGWGAYLAAIILLFSKAFVDFSTSGLENPLSHLLLAFFVWGYLKIYSKNQDERNMIGLSLVVGLSVLNRMDTILLFLPSLVIIFIMRPGWRMLKDLLIGFTPFILWEIFSIVYYGFPFPNTAYAKLNILVPRKDLIEQGILYLFNSIKVDPLTLLTIMVAILITISKKHDLEKGLVTGILLYIGYVIWIGGDFMSGRFFALPLYLSAFLIIGALDKLKPIEVVFVFALIVIVGLSATPNNLAVYPHLQGNNYAEYRVDQNGIDDERLVDYGMTGLLNVIRGRDIPFGRLAEQGVKLRIERSKIFVSSAIGIQGYYAGPNMHIVDTLGLGDPLLARIPIFINSDWRIGHFRRDIPADYLRTIKSDKNYIVDPSLAEYYDKLSIIVSGPIWSWERFKVIWAMNTGQYDHLMDEYVSHRQQEITAP